LITAAMCAFGLPGGNNNPFGDRVDATGAPLTAYPIGFGDIPHRIITLGITFPTRTNCSWVGEKLVG